MKETGPNYRKKLLAQTAWKVSVYGVFSGPFFPVFGLNMEIYSVNLRIQFEYRKIRNSKNSLSGQFSRSDRPSGKMTGTKKRNQAKMERAKNLWSFSCYEKSLISRRETGYWALLSTNFGVFLIFFSFLRS